MTRTAKCQDPRPVCGTLEHVEPLGTGGLLALRLRRPSGGRVEVLADAASAMEELARVFGTAERALGQRIELSLDVFGFPRLEGAAAGAALPADSGTSRPPGWVSDPGGRLNV